MGHKTPASNLIESSFRAEARALIERVRARTRISHAGLKGQAAEDLLREFLDVHLPARFRATTGVVLDVNQTQSPQIDVIVVDRDNCPALPVRAVPANAVPVAIELKLRLRTQHLRKAIQVAAKLKRLGKSAKELWTLDESGRGTLESLRFPFLTQMHLLGIFSAASMSSIARAWHRLYCSVPFGCQLDLIASLDRGLMCIGAWHPGRRYTRGQISPVYGLWPGHEDAQGPSVLLFPDICSKDWNATRWVRVGPRVPWQVGSCLFITAVESPDVATAEWLRFLLAYLSTQVQRDHFETLGSPGDGLIPNSVEIIPLAIAVDPHRLEVEREQYVAAAVLHLLRAEFTAESIEKLL